METREQEITQRKEAGQSDRFELLGRKILEAAKRELYLSMRYLSPALERPVLIRNQNIHPLAADGEKIAFHPMFLSRMYQDNPVLVNRAYLHSVLHCLFSHMDLDWNSMEAESAEEHNAERMMLYRDLACDAAVEMLIDSIELPSVQIMVPYEKQRFSEYLQKNVRILSAEKIYRFLRSHCSEAEAVMEAEYFRVDDHAFWPHPQEQQSPEKKKKQQQERELWKEVRKKIQTDLETYSRSVGEEKTRLYQSIRYENRERYSYEEFLRKFAAPQEEMKIDPDSFDYGYYSYGLQLYGNMPLIEEPEYRIRDKIREFVIVLDTSGSCSKEVIADFLGETVSVLTSGSRYLEGGICHVLQCDNQIQSCTDLRTAEELENYCRQFQIIGRGGTDFRPAFQWIDQKLREGSWKKIAGVLYFTDGYGIYPEWMPPYKTAFLFPEDSDTAENAPWEGKEFPVWAMHLVVKNRKQWKDV